jgi:hypothetical protein
VLVPALVVAVVAVGGCGRAGVSTGPGSGSRVTGTATVLNTAKIERAIEQSSLIQRGVRAQVTCPARVRQAKGTVFTCVAVVDHHSTQFVVTELDAFGDVHYIGR